MIAIKSHKSLVTFIPQPKQTITEPSAPVLSEIAPQIDAVSELAALQEQYERKLKELINRGALRRVSPIRPVGVHERGWEAGRRLNGAKRPRSSSTLPSWTIVILRKSD